MNLSPEAERATQDPRCVNLKTAARLKGVSVPTLRLAIIKNDVALRYRRIDKYGFRVEVVVSMDDVDDLRFRKYGSKAKR